MRIATPATHRRPGRVRGWAMLGIGWLLWLTVAGGGASPVGAAPTPPPDGQVLDLPLTVDDPPQDITLQGTGAGSRRTLVFPVYPHWQIRPQTELRLALRYTPLVLADRSEL